MQGFNRFYSLVSSMKTGLFLLFLIGVTAAVGSSVLPGSFYQIPVFKLLLLLLLINMILCTFNRIKLTYRVLLKRFGSRVWFRQLGILTLHLGIVLVLVGGLIYATSGQNERIHLLAGDQVDISQVLDIKHPFTLQLDEFRIEFNEDGSPSQYISEVTILEKGRIMDQVEISVNYPLSYQGVKAYQTSYGYLVQAAYLDENGAEKAERFFEGEWLYPDGTNRRVKIYKYIPNFNPAYGMQSVTLRPDNPHIIISVYENDELLGIGAAKLNEPTEIDENVYVTFTGVEPYTILEVKSDPGLPLVITGGFALMLGVCLAILAAPGRKKNTIKTDDIHE
ncbi:MAG TPA: cytochrome c biogenesis protein ResB [Syntrophomonadaceae bacterium]|nr:cytochrome c biogenesis protein ResB [Syntrophomonadaceae bacterium]